MTEKNYLKIKDMLSTEESKYHTDSDAIIKLTIYVHNMYMCLMTKITHETLILNTFLYDCIVKINKMYVYLQGKLESRLEDNVYSIQGRLSKIESAVSRDRQIINDLQGVCFNIY